MIHLYYYNPKIIEHLYLQFNKLPINKEEISKVNSTKISGVPLIFCPFASGRIGRPVKDVIVFLCPNGGGHVAGTSDVELRLRVFFDSSDSSQFPFRHFFNRP